MRRARLVRIVIAAAGVLLITGARDPILVPEVSQHEVRLQQGFNGTELLLFGALLTPEGTRAGGDYDIVVVLSGPTQAVIVRRKKRVAGIWVNGDSTGMRSAPGYFAIASSRPIASLVDDRTAAIYELGLPWLQLSPIGAIDPEEQARFAAGLVGLRSRQNLYSQNDHGVTISGGVLYQARITLPSNLPTGDYTAETFAIRKGRVVASAMNQVAVRKIGAEAAIADFAENWSLLYGLATVALSLAMGWLASRFLQFG
jgi:uncharacterized protein (TIGR02186 family)